MQINTQWSQQYHSGEKFDRERPSFAIKDRFVGRERPSCVKSESIIIEI